MSHWNYITCVEHINSKVSNKGVTHQPQIANFKKVAFKKVVKKKAKSKKVVNNESSNMTKERENGVFLYVQSR